MKLELQAPTDDAGHVLAPAAAMEVTMVLEVEAPTMVSEVQAMTMPEVQALMIVPEV